MKFITWRHKVMLESVFDIPEFTLQTNANGVLNVLEAYRRSCPNA